MSQCPERRNTKPEDQRVGSELPAYPYSSCSVCSYFDTAFGTPMQSLGVSSHMEPQSRGAEVSAIAKCKHKCRFECCRLVLWLCGPGVMRNTHSETGLAELAA